MKLTVKNNFHNTEATIKVAYTYENSYCEKIAAVDIRDLVATHWQLCATKDCHCGKIYSGVDKNGQVYHIIPS